MALLGQIGQISSVVGESLSLVNTLTQRQVSITEKPAIPGTTISIPVIGKNVVILEVVEVEDMTLSVNITDKPVADLGSAIDYISRNPPEFSIDGVISNRNMNVLSDPIGFALQQAGAAFPEVASAINEAAELGSKFFDLGGDEMDNKIKQLYSWKVNATYVRPLGIRLDINKWIQDIDSINWLVKDVNLNHSLDTGDGLGFSIKFYGMLGINTSLPVGIGSFLQNARKDIRTLGGINPFGGL